VLYVSRTMKGCQRASLVFRDDTKISLLDRSRIRPQTLCNVHFVREETEITGLVPDEEKSWLLVGWG